MKSTLFTVGPYMDMLLDGMFKPIEEHEDGTLVWENPAGKSSPRTNLSSILDERKCSMLI
jgi:hypothetical protein